MLSKFKKLFLGSVLVVMAVVLGACSDDVAGFYANFYLDKDFTIASLGEDKMFTQTGNLTYSATDINPVGKKETDFTTPLQTNLKKKLEKTNTNSTVDVREAVVLSGEVEANQELVITVEVTITDKTSPDNTKTQSYVFIISFGTGLGKWDGTTATEITPVGDIYKIYNGSHLAWIAEQTRLETPNNFTDKTVMFMNSIDMDNKSFNGIGTFGGKLDGNGKSIYGLNIYRQGVRNVGLISILGNGGSIDNLTIAEGSSIKGKSSVGAFVGEVADDAKVTITGVINHATVEGTGNYIGGLIGATSTGTITVKDSLNTGNVKGASTIGGLIGQNGHYVITVKDSSNIGNVTGSGITVGGIVGYSTNAVTLTNVHSYAKSVTTRDEEFKGSAGGIVGRIPEGQKIIATNVYWLHDTTDSVVGVESAQGTFGHNPSVPTLTNSKALTIAEFKVSTNFNGWDFVKVWEIVNSLYPTLKKPVATP